MSPSANWQTEASCDWPGGPAAQPLKIALLCDWFYPRWGGLEQHLLDLARELTGRGHEVHIVTAIPGPSELEGLRVFRLAGLRFPYFDFLCSLSPFRQLSDLLAKEKYDLVHVHASYVSPLAWGGAFLSQRASIPTVFTFHSRLFGFRFVLAAANLLFRWWRWNMEFSAVSSVVAQELEPLVRSPMAILPTGIDARYWKAVPLSDGHQGPIVIVSVMRFGPRKRGTALVRMFAELKRQLLPGGPQVRLVIIGEGRLRWEIEAAVAHNRLQEDVVLTGHLSHDAIREAFASSDIFVLPSRVESFGTAALEARCAGLPIVAHAEGGVRSFVCHGIEGLLAGTDEGMVACLLRLVRDEPLRRSIREHNCATWPDFDWATVAAQHENAYRRTIASTRGEPSPADRDKGTAYDAGR